MKLKKPKLSDKQKLKYASLSLRIGLALVLLYAGIQALRSPDAWIGFVPSFVSHFTSLKTALDILSIIQIGLAVILIAGQYVVYASLVAIGLLGGIMVFNPGTILITFRDIGLIFAAVSIILLEI